jgi:hypothetical protein
MWANTTAGNNTEKSGKDGRKLPSCLLFWIIAKDPGVIEKKHVLCYGKSRYSAFAGKGDVFA